MREICAGLFMSTLMVSAIVAAPTAQVLIDPDSYRCQDFISAAQMQQSRDQMMEVEHCDRIARIARVAQHSIIGAEPKFFVAHIPAEKIPMQARADVPMLRVVFPQRVFFDTASSDLRPEAHEVVQIIAQSLNQDMPDVSMFVAGHTDARGGHDYNQNLSVDRANTVARAILNEGVHIGTVWRVGFGEDMPLVPNVDVDAMGYNRRVEFLFASNEQAIGVWLADTQVDGLCSGSSESATSECRASLDLRSDYVALEISIPKKVSISPDIGRQQVDMQATPIAISPVAPTNVVDVVAQRHTIVDPIPGRRIVINPINRTSQLQAKANGAD